MAKRILSSAIMVLFLTVLLLPGCMTDTKPERVKLITATAVTLELPPIHRDIDRIAPVVEQNDTVTVEASMEQEPVVTPEEESVEDIFGVSEEDIELIALVTMAEAEGEPEEGKRLVIDTILNRVDSEHFPDSVYEVIYQPHHFTSMWNGRADRCEVRDDICELVREELASRLNSDVIFFNANRYSDYGVPLFQVGNHCFSSYD